MIHMFNLGSIRAKMKLGLNTFVLRVFDFRIWDGFDPLFILILGELVLLI